MGLVLLLQRSTTYFIFFFLFLYPTFSIANDELSLSVAGQVSISPYKNYDIQWTPIPIIGYEGEHTFIRGYTAGIKVMNNKSFEFSFFAGYDGTNFNPSDSSDSGLRKLSHRYSSMIVGLETRLITPYGMLYVNANQDILGNSKGQNGRSGYITSFEYKNLEIIPTIGLEWSSKEYNQYYYGVSKKESNKSGIKTYKADFGISAYTGVTFNYSIDQDWEVFCSGELFLLSETIRNSPMVDKSVTSNFAFGLSYNF